MRQRIYTETGSVHEIDTDAQTYVRLHNAHELRRDGEFIPMVSAALIEDGGRRLEVWLRLREDGVLTRRVTAPITKVEEL